MDKKLEKSLRHIQSHPTTGTPHNQQLISTQVESIFAIDNLQKEIRKLVKTIIRFDKKNTKLEISNLRLQKQMLLLTTAATMIVVFQFLQTINFSDLIVSVSNILEKAGILLHPGYIATITTTIIIIVAGLMSFYYQRKYVSQTKEEMEFLKSVLKDIDKRKTKISKIMKQNKKD